MAGWAKAGRLGLVEMCACVGVLLKLEGAIEFDDFSGDGRFLDFFG